MRWRVLGIGLIIGLIIDCVLVGQSLIKVAHIRSQISQIERFQTATHAFQLKYGSRQEIFRTPLHTASQVQEAMEMVLFKATCRALFKDMVKVLEKQSCSGSI